MYPIVRLKKDILDYNVTLRALHVILETISSMEASEEEIVNILSKGETDLVVDALGFLQHLEIVTVKNGIATINLNTKYERTILRPIILRALRNKTYIGKFLEKYFDKKYLTREDFTKILREAKEAAYYENLEQKTNFLIRHLRELGLAYRVKGEKSRKEIIIPTVDPSLIIEIAKFENIKNISFTDFLNRIEKYIPCRRELRGLITPFKRALHVLNLYGIVELKTLSDAGIPYDIAENIKANYLVFKHE